MTTKGNQEIEEMMSHADEVEAAIEKAEKQQEAETARIYNAISKAEKNMEKQNQEIEEMMSHADEVEAAIAKAKK